MRHVAASIRRPGRFTTLLLSILLVGGSLPVAEELRGGTPVFGEALVIVLVAAGCYAAAARKRHFFALTAVGALAAALLASDLYVRDARLAAAGGILMILFFASVAVIIAEFVMRAGRVTPEVLSAVMCVYLLIGIAWGFAYWVVELLHPGSLRVEKLSRWELVYFSFATLTTVGYTAVEATSRIAKSLTVTEAVVGQLFVAVVISQIVGMRVAHVMSAPPRHPDDRADPGDRRVA